MTRFAPFAAILSTALLLAAGAWAGESEFESALEGLATAVEQEENLSPEFKAALTKVVEGLRDQASRAGPHSERPPVSGEKKGFFDRIHASADMRLRYEFDGNRPDDKKDRNRARARFRIGAKYDVTEEVTAAFRIRTGNPDDPNSPHQTFGGMFDSWEFNLDRVYLKYTPEWLPGAWVLGGKAANPFVTNPVYGELVWDADVNPEGAAGGYTWSGESAKAGLSVGGYVPISADSHSMTMITAQIFSKNDWTDDLSTKVALGYYGYQDTEPGGDLSAVKDNRGNALKPVGVDADGEIIENYVSNFGILNPIVSVAFDLFGFPVTVSGEHFWNARSNSGDDQGFAVGTSTKFPLLDRTHKLFYQYQRVEQESVFSPFAQDDFPLATNFKGHVLGFDWELLRGVKLRTWALLARPIRNDAESNRVQGRFRTDINVTF